MEREQRLAAARRGSKLRVAGLVVLAIALVAGAVALYRSPLLTVRRYRLVGAKHLTLARVLAEAKPPTDATLVRFPSGTIRDRVAADPWVRSVTVHRRFPDAVEIQVVERTPAALVDAAGARWLVDRDGWVIEKRAATETGTVPVVRKVEKLAPKAGTQLASPVLRNALAVISGLSTQLRRSARFVDAPSIDETALLTNENVDILIGSADDLSKKDVIARQILAAQHGRVVFIDVRSTDRPISRALGE